MVADAPADATKRRAPFGVAAVAVAGVASLPVWAFDDLEGALGDVMPEGPNVILLIVAAFAAIWFLVGGAILAVASPRPDREGLLAGALVALLMLGILVWEADEPWQVVAFVWTLFGGLAVGCGAVAGLIGLRLQGGAAPASGRAAAVAAVGCACVIGLAATPFLGLGGSTALFVLALIAVLAGAGAWWLLRAPAPSPPS